MNPFGPISGLRKTGTYCLSLIIITWISGLLCALLYIKQASFSLMYPLYVERVSIVGMIVSLIFPIILLYILLNRCYFYLTLPVIFLKSFSYMCCYLCITYSYGTAGWLVRIFLLFSDTVSIVILLHFCYRFAAGNKTGIIRYFKCAFAVLIIVGCLDYYIISPFILMLLNH